MTSKSVEIYIAFLIRISISTIFLLSCLGKVVDYNSAALIISKLFLLPYNFANFFIILLSIFEAGLVILVWKEKFLKFILYIPILFSGIVIFSNMYKIDCGCFGSLPFLNQFSFISHLILLTGIFLGIYYLIELTKISQRKINKNVLSKSLWYINKSFRWIGCAALFLMLLAFISHPFTYSNKNTDFDAKITIVDLFTLETTISKGDAVIIDARAKFQYDLGHIPDAVNIPYNVSNLKSFIKKNSLLSKSIIVYCSSFKCTAAEILIKRLLINKCKDIMLYAGGWEEWKNKYY